jgi:hypothetical protein
MKTFKISSEKTKGWQHSKKKLKVSKKRPRKNNEKKPKK